MGVLTFDDEFNTLSAADPADAQGKQAVGNQFLL